MDQVLRIHFVSGRVAERRGTDEHVWMMFAQDETHLIDYVMSLEIDSGYVAFFTREGDDRFDEEAVFTSEL